MKRYALLLMAMTYASALNQEGLVGVNQIFSAKTSGHLNLGVSLGSLLANDEQNFGGGTLTENGTVYNIKSYLTASSQFAMALGLGNYTEFGIALPLYYEKIEGGGFSKEEHLPGDLQFRVKAELPLPDQNIFHIGVLLGASALTAQDGGTIPRKLELFTNDPAEFSEGSTPFGTGRPGVIGALAVTLDFQDLLKHELRWHLNGGVRKPNLTTKPDFQDIVFGGTAVEWGPLKYLLLSAELYHESRFDQIGGTYWLDQEPTTLTFTATARTPVGVQFTAGGTLGLFGRDPIGVHYTGKSDISFTHSTTSQFAIYAQLTWSGALASMDKDGDGIPNDEDSCSLKPEDLDGYEDRDGCPDLDDDKDGIPDTQDKCRMEPEDKDGFEDEDGCPDPDNDRDGIPDFRDKCTNLPQGPDGKEGCPNVDADNDGVLDMNDKCPSAAEDKDLFEDEDGCPELDNDNDGIADTQDKCPNAPETMNKFADEDGCPDKIEIREIVKTLILRGVNFRTGSAELMSESFPVLDSVAAQLMSYPETNFEVAGHTDNAGVASKNQMLSQSRAQTVANYFILKGVESKRLKVMGYGQAKPMGSNKTAEGKALNRRVELNRLP